jgi:hypothetical protein
MQHATRDAMGCLLRHAHQTRLCRARGPKNEFQYCPDDGPSLVVGTLTSEGNVMNL